MPTAGLCSSFTPRIWRGHTARFVLTRLAIVRSVNIARPHAMPVSRSSLADHGASLINGDIEDIGGNLCIICPFHRYKITLDKGRLEHGDSASPATRSDSTMHNHDRRGLVYAVRFLRWGHQRLQTTPDVQRSASACAFRRGGCARMCGLAWACL